MRMTHVAPDVQDGDGVGDSPKEHAGMYWCGAYSSFHPLPRLLATLHVLNCTAAAAARSWRPAFVAALRQKLGEKALILANSAGAVSDPSLSGPHHSWPVAIRRNVHGSSLCSGFGLPTGLPTDSLPLCLFAFLPHGRHHDRDGVLHGRC